MQSSTGQYSTQAGDPAQPVQHSVITASSFGFFLRGVVIPLDLGSCFSSTGTMPAGADLTASDSVAMGWDYTSIPFVCIECSSTACIAFLAEFLRSRYAQNKILPAVSRCAPQTILDSRCTNPLLWHTNSRINDAREFVRANC